MKATREYSGTHILHVGGIFVQGHMLIMWNLYMQVVMVTCFIALSSCQVDILT